MVNNSRITTVFFGTSHFAVPILEKLISDERFVIKAVITQPDRPVGRHQQVEESPVKAIAKNNNIPILQPDKIKSPEILAALKKIDAELNIVAAYGQIIPDNILNLPQHNSINVHSSLLPLYRGASPIHNAILNNEKETGVTIMLMDAKMDHGPILSQQSVKIMNDDITPSLELRLAEAGANLLVKTAIDWVAGKITPQEQDHSQATFTKILTRQDGHIDWNNSAEYISRQRRAYAPWPGIFTFWQDKKIELLNVEVVNRDLKAGLVIEDNGSMIIGCGDKALKINQLQLAGKKVTSGQDFLRGHPTIINATLK